MGCVALHIGFQLIDSACCESLSHASGVPAPFHKGAFFAQHRYGSNDETPESMGFPGVFYCFREVKIPKIRVSIWAAASSPP